MSNNINRISVNKIESIFEANNVKNIYIEGTEKMEIQIFKSLSLSDMLAFVGEVVESCVDGENGEYVPEAYDFAVRAGVLARYANIAMPSNMEKRYALVYETDIFEQIMRHINQRQFEDIMKAIDRKINYMLDVLSSAAVSKINEVVAKFSEIAETSEKVFGNIEPEKMTDFIGGISRLKDMKDEKIADVIVKAASGDKNG